MQDIPREYLIKRLGGVQTGADVTGTPGWKEYISATYQRDTPAGAPKMVRASASWSSAQQSLDVLHNSPSPGLQAPARLPHCPTLVLCCVHPAGLQLSYLQLLLPSVCVRMDGDAGDCMI